MVICGGLQLMKVEDMVETALVASDDHSEGAGAIPCYLYHGFSKAPQRWHAAWLTDLR